MKKSLLEYLIRECTSELLDQLAEAENNNHDGEEISPILPPSEDDDDKFDYEDSEEETSSPETPQSDSSDSSGEMNKDFDDNKSGEDNSSNDEDGEQSSASTSTNPVSDLKGVVLVNPRDTSKLQPIPLSGNDATIERNLHRVATALGGGSNNIKTSLGAMRAVKDAVKNPTEPVFVYLGKYDPDSSEIFIMADKSLQVAKDSSIDPNDINGEGGVAQDTFNPLSASANDFATRMQSAGATPRTEMDETLKKLISKVIKETLSK